MAYSAVRKRYWLFLTEEFNPVIYDVFSYEETVLVLLTEKTVFVQCVTLCTSKAVTIVDLIKFSSVL